MRVLVTSTRMPFALDEVRKLGRMGHAVIAADTFATAPGSHSRHVERAYLVCSPRRDTRRFIDDVARIVRDEAIDLVLPCFEEVFFLASERGLLPPGTRLFLPRFGTLAALHDKARASQLARRLALRTPRTVVVSSRRELHGALGAFPRYVARAAFSRGGERLLTNTGPLAGVVALEECNPTPTNPWVVQEFIDGADVCSFSVVHHGRVVAHSTYVHPREIEHAGGIVFESIDEPEALAFAQTIARATRYHGQLSFDFRRSDAGLVLIECNPRPTAGVFALSPEAFEDALLDRHPGAVYVAPAGVRHKYSVALVRDMVLHWREAREDLAHLLSDARDVYADQGDPWPALYQLLSYSHVLAYRLKRERGSKRSALLGAYFDDVSWDGEPIGAGERSARPAPGELGYFAL
jgi:predicted ATP-grasp superfamily ATP-dependent carboligase